MSEKDEQLLRHGVKTVMLREFVEALGSKWGLIFAKYAYLVGRSDFTRLFLHIARKIRCRGEEDLMDQLKEIGRLSVEFSVLVSDSVYSFLMDIHTLGGYDTILHKKDVMATIADEVGVAPEPIDSVLQEEMLSRIRKIVKSCIRVNPEPFSFEHFVGFRDVWATQGASTLDGGVYLEASDGYKKKVKGKLANSLRYTDAQLCELARESGQRAIIRPFLKEDEPGKARVVYGYDFRSYLRCSFADRLVKSWEGDKAWCPVGYDARKKAMMRLNLMTSMNGKRTAVSLDQSAFDTRQRKEWVACAIESIFERLIESYEGLGLEHIASQLKELKEVELQSFATAHVEGVCDWKVGVPSGHKWTAMVDSFLNRASAELNAERGGFEIETSYFQGDDAILIGYEKAGEVDWPALYSDLGLKVNDSKTWISKEGFDFLHEIYRGREVRAFPARIGRALIWKKPNLGRDVGSAESRLRERLADCLRGARRGLESSRSVAIGAILRFAKTRKQSVRESTVVEAVSTPCFLGGFGFGRTGRMSFSFEGGEVVTERYTIKSGVVGMSRQLYPALISRLSGSVMLRTSECRILFRRVVCTKQTPRSGSFGYSIKIKTSWSVEDGVEWARSLRLEMKLLGRGKSLFSVADIPDGRLRAMGLRGVDVLRRYKKYVSKLNFNLDCDKTTGESWAAVADKCNRYWIGICAWFAELGKDISADLEKETTMVRGWLLGYVHRWGITIKV